MTVGKSEIYWLKVELLQTDVTLYFVYFFFHPEKEDIVVPWALEDYWIKPTTKPSNQHSTKMIQSFQKLCHKIIELSKNDSSWWSANFFPDALIITNWRRKKLANLFFACVYPKSIFTVEMRKEIGCFFQCFK